ncbi:MAG TPA: hypothetical protein VFB07_09760 [Vicinamibacterales bacterium]|nr:hypothetical protein [Vicinamibacterales bacterium]
MRGHSMLFALLVALGVPISAAAQGPMTFQPVGSGWAATPEVKETEVDHRAGTLVGGNAGWIADQTFFIGGAGYWLANGNHDRELGYGGLLLQWIGRGNERVGFAAKALVGGGTGTLTDTVTTYVVVSPPSPAPNQPGQPRVIVPPVTRPVTQQVRVRSDFAVFEPELDAHVRFSDWARLTAGAGYRVIGNGNHYGYYDGSLNNDRLEGWVGTIGVTFGGGF